MSDFNQFNQDDTFSRRMHDKFVKDIYRNRLKATKIEYLKDITDDVLKDYVKKDKKSLLYSEFMDYKMSIDTIIYTKYNQTISLQEKLLRYKSTYYPCFTFEYYNDPAKETKGEWFKLYAQLYFFGFVRCDEQDRNNGLYIEKYFIVNIPNFKIKLDQYIESFASGFEGFKKKHLKDNTLIENKANFFSINFSLLESWDGVVLYKHP